MLNNRMIKLALALMVSFTVIQPSWIMAENETPVPASVADTQTTLKTSAEPTETITVTEEPMITESPVVIATSDPLVTETPEVTEIPEATAAPEVTASAQPSETPSADPEVTSTPETASSEKLMMTAAVSAGKLTLGLEDGYFQKNRYLQLLITDHNENQTWKTLYSPEIEIPENTKQILIYYIPVAADSIVNADTTQMAAQAKKETTDSPTIRFNTSRTPYNYIYLEAQDLSAFDIHVSIQMKKDTPLITFNVPQGHFEDHESQKVIQASKKNITLAEAIIEAGIDSQNVISDNSNLVFKGWKRTTGNPNSMSGDYGVNKLIEDPTRVVMVNNTFTYEPIWEDTRTEYQAAYQFANLTVGTIEIDSSIQYSTPNVFKPMDVSALPETVKPGERLEICIMSPDGLNIPQNNVSVTVDGQPVKYSLIGSDAHYGEAKGSVGRAYKIILNNIAGDVQIQASINDVHYTVNVYFYDKFGNLKEMLPQSQQVVEGTTISQLSADLEPTEDNFWYVSRITEAGSDENIQKTKTMSTVPDANGNRYEIDLSGKMYLNRDYAAEDGLEFNMHVIPTFEVVFESFTDNHTQFPDHHATYYAGYGDQTTFYNVTGYGEVFDKLNYMTAAGLPVFEVQALDGYEIAGWRIREIPENEVQIPGTDRYYQVNDIVTTEEIHQMGTVKGKTKFYAEVKRIDVRFITDGHGFVDGLTEVSYNQQKPGTEIAVPEVSAETDYHFSGWVLEADGTDASISDVIAPQDSVTYRAVFEANKPEPTPSMTPTTRPDAEENPEPNPGCPAGTTWNEATQNCEALAPAVVVPVNPQNPQNPQAPEEVIDDELTPEQGGQEVKPAPTAPAEENIENELTPEAGKKGSWALVNLIASLIGLIAGIILVFAKHSKEEEADEENTENQPELKKRSRIYKAISVLSAVLSVIVFILTENMRLPMVLIDKWTLLMIVFLLINVVTLILGRRWHEQDVEEEA